ncbi:MAG: O-antigen ligase family protein [Bacilli bacterium]
MEQTKAVIVKKSHGDVLDIVLFYLLGLLASVFTLGGFEASSSPINNINGFIFLNTFIYYSPQSASSLFFFIPSVLLYVGILFWFIYLRYQKTGKLPSKYLFSIFSLIVVVRFISAVSFPYGEQTFTFLFPDTNSSVDVTYSGYSLSDRIIGFTNEILFYSFFLVAIDYYKTFSDKMKTALKITQYIVILAGLGLIVAAWIISAKDLIGNLKYYLGDSSAKLAEGISSLTSHRNVFGFMLMMSTISCFALMMNKKNPWLIVIVAIDIIHCFLIYSRTPFILSSLVFVMLHVWLLFKKQKKSYRIYSVVLLSTVVLLGIVFLIIMRDKLASVLSHLGSDTTINTRELFWTHALSMLNNPYYYIFGYGRVPFFSTFSNYQLATKSEAFWSAHNGYLDVLLEFGIIGLLFLVALLSFFIYRIVVLFKQDGTKAFPYLVILTTISIYSIFEPRMLGLMEGSNIIFFVIFCLPLLGEEKTYKPSSKRLETLTAKISIVE